MHKLHTTLAKLINNSLKNENIDFHFTEKDVKQEISNVLESNPEKKKEIQNILQIFNDKIYSIINKEIKKILHKATQKNLLYYNSDTQDINYYKINTQNFQYWDQIFNIPTQNTEITQSQDNTQNNTQGKSYKSSKKPKRALPQREKKKPKKTK